MVRRSLVLICVYVFLMPVFSASAGQNATDTLQSRLTQALEKHHVVGASAAVFQNDRLDTAAAGIANLSTGYKIEPDSLMHIGSVTKVLTATLVMQLVDEGLVDLDAPFTKYVKDHKVRFPSAFNAITVRMLLNHSNGVNGDMFPQGGHDDEIIVKAVERIAREPLLFEPGSNASYSNGGMVLAGYLVEQVRGISWYDAVKSKIFLPAGMMHSIVLPEEAILYKTSVGHLVDGKTKNVYRSPSAFMQLSFAPAGVTTMMTAADLVTFGRIHLNNGVAPNGTRILSAESVRLMQQTQARYKGYGAQSSWGLGWDIADSGVVRHGGGGTGVNALLVVLPVQNFVAAVMTNTETGRAVIADIVNPYLSQFAPEQQTDLPSLSPPSGIMVDHYVGRYEDVLARFDISAQDGQLFGVVHAKIKAYDNFSDQPTPPRPLEAIGKDIFALHLDPGMAGMPQGGKMMLTFLNPDKDGKMQHIATRNHLYPRR